MSKSGGLSDTKEIKIQREPDPHTHGRSQPAHTAIRRASMTGGRSGTGGKMPARRPPSAGRQTSAAAENPQKKRSKPKKVHRIGIAWRIGIIFAVLLFALFAVYSVISVLAVSKLRSADRAERSLTVGAADYDPDVRNILLVGTDAAGTDCGLAESITLLSISSANHSITASAVLRDCYVSIPGHGTNRLSSAYAYGGGDLLIDTVTNNFGIRVDDYITYGMNAAVLACDAVGGVSITLSDEEKNALNKMLRNELNEQFGDPAEANIVKTSGTQLLTGKQALAYARIRFLGNGDFDRTQRQQNVLSGILTKLMSGGFGAMYTLTRDAFPEMTTNLSVGSLYLLALKYPYYMLRYQTKMLRIPADGTYSDLTSPEGAQVLAIDFDANSRIFADAVHE